MVELSQRGELAGDVEDVGGGRSGITSNSTNLAVIKTGASWVLDCTMCHCPLNTPIFQCIVGHCICSGCWMNLADHDYQCHLCSYGGYSRCFAMENIIENLKFPCANEQYGCDMVMLHFELDEHAAKCLHHPCCCPYSGCQFIGPTESSHDHIRDVHKEPIINFSYGRKIKVVLPRSCKFKVMAAEDCIFLLKRDTLRRGASNLSIVCIRTSPSKRPHFRYNLKTDASVGTCPGAYLELCTPVNDFSCDAKLKENNISLVVPPAAFAPNGDVHVFATIRKIEPLNSRS